MNTPEYVVRLGDVLLEPSDLLLLKHAQSFYGADRAVMTMLVSSGLCDERDLRLKPGDFKIIETQGRLAPARVMFLGTPDLTAFDYDEIQGFAQRFIEILSSLSMPLKVLTTTVHGGGYGLDEGESLQRLICGFQRGLSAASSTDIGKIEFLTNDERAKRTLESVLTQMDLPAEIPNSEHVGITHAATDPGQLELEKEDHGIRQTDAASMEEIQRVDAVARKKSVFVAMPYSEEFENVYEFGIYPAVRNCGFICERVDKTHFTGDILHRVRHGIETAFIVIADLTEGRPNVYLEVGYAWGRGIPVILLARKGELVHFDLSTHRCLYYGKFTQLAKDLEQLLRGLEAPEEIKN